MESRLNFTRTLDELKEQEAELQRQNEDDQAVINDEDALPSEKQATEGRVEERQEELARLRAQIDERGRALPLRERVKEIFKKYSVTVTAIVLAAGFTIGAVIGALTNALRATGKVGKRSERCWLKGCISSARSYWHNCELSFQSRRSSYRFSC